MKLITGVKNNIYIVSQIISYRSNCYRIFKHNIILQNTIGTVRIQCNNTFYSKGNK